MEDIEVDQICNPCVMHAPIAEDRVLCCLLLLSDHSKNKHHRARSRAGAVLGVGRRRRRRQEEENASRADMGTSSTDNTGWAFSLDALDSPIDTHRVGDSWVLGGNIRLRLKVRMTVSVSTFESAIDAAEDTER